jgi:hypothetical protein
VEGNLRSLFQGGKMAKKSHPPKSDEIKVTSSPLTPDDEELNKLFDHIEVDSLETREDTARQIITWSTTLLGAFFGLLAFKDMPVYLEYVEVKFLGGFALVSFLFALIFALGAVSPKRYDFPRSSLSAKRKALDEMITHKHAMVRGASLGFGLGALLMLAAALDILIFRI